MGGVGDFVGAAAGLAQVTRGLASVEDADDCDPVRLYFEVDRDAPLEACDADARTEVFPAGAAMRGKAQVEASLRDPCDVAFGVLGEESICEVAFQFF